MLASEEDWNDAIAHAVRWSVQWAILNVMKDVGAIGKDSRNDAPGAKYDFRGIDAVMNAVAPRFLRYGVTITPKIRKVVNRQADKTTNDGKILLWSEVEMDYVLEAVDGTQRIWQAPGAAMDTGDKAIGKAMSVAFRIACLQGLCIPTSQPDPDSFTYGHEEVQQGDGYQTHGRGENVRQEQAQPQGEPMSEADKVRMYTLNVMREFEHSEGKPWTGQDIRNKFHDLYQKDYVTEDNLELLKAFGKTLRDDAIQDRAMEEQRATENVLSGLGGTVVETPEEAATE